MAVYLRLNEGISTGTNLQPAYLFNSVNSAKLNIPLILKSLSVVFSYLRSRIAPGLYSNSLLQEVYLPLPGPNDSSLNTKAFK